MSSFLKILLVLVIIVGVILAVRSYRTPKNQPQALPEKTLSEGSDDSNLNSDLATIDAQLKAVDEGSADIDSGLNDKPVAQ